ncbi:hypothetical protein KAR91_81520 [Candidatus Pacearchaeota archaeon]|nr:hypothetical protein [Candidatus Pacearchaeota archaeon]
MTLKRILNILEERKTLHSNNIQLDKDIKVDAYENVGLHKEVCRIEKEIRKCYQS